MKVSYILSFVFQIEAPDVGMMSHVIVGHDDFGPGAGWYLDEVIYKLLQ
jgi:hypothetical protein